MGVDFRTRRAELRLTQGEVADALRVSVRTIARAEHSGPVTATILRELCRFLALSVDRVVRPTPEEVDARLVARGLTLPSRRPPVNSSESAIALCEHLGADGDLPRVGVIVGPDGSGKRALALETAETFIATSGRVGLWLGADRLATPGRVKALRFDIATALGFDQCLPDGAGVPAGELERAFRRELWKHDVLMVISEIESAEAIAELVGDEPNARCIVTTAEPLAAPGHALTVSLGTNPAANDVAHPAPAFATPASILLSPEARVLLKALGPLKHVAFDPWWVSGAASSRLDGERALDDLLAAGLAVLDRPAGGRPRLRIAARAFDGLDPDDADAALFALADMMIEHTATLIAAGWKVTQDWVVANRSAIQALLDQLSPTEPMPSFADLATPDAIPEVEVREGAARRLGAFLAQFDLMAVHRPRLMLAEWVVPALAATRRAGPRSLHAAMLRITGWWRTLSRLGHGSGDELLRASYELSLAAGDYMLAASTLSYLGGNALGLGQLEENARLQRETIRLSRERLDGIERACMINRSAVSISMAGGSANWAQVATLFDEAAGEAAPVNPWIEATARLNAATSRLLADARVGTAELDGALRRFWALIPKRRPMFEAVILGHGAHFGVCPDGLAPETIWDRAKAAWTRWIFPAEPDADPPDPMAVTNFLFFIAMWAPNPGLLRPMTTGMATVNVSDAPVVRGGVDITDLLLVSVAAIERFVDDELLLALQASTDTFVCDGSFFRRDLQLILRLRGLGQ